MWNDTAEQNRAYVWKNFLSGNQVIFMDPYVIFYPRENRNLCSRPIQGVCSGPDPRWDNVPRQFGICSRVCKSCKLAAMSPQGNLFSNESDSRMQAPRMRNTWDIPRAVAQLRLTCGQRQACFHWNGLIPQLGQSFPAARLPAALVRP